MLESLAQIYLTITKMNSLLFFCEICHCVYKKNHVCSAKIRPVENHVSQQEAATSVNSNYTVGSEEMVVDELDAFAQEDHQEFDIDEVLINEVCKRPPLDDARLPVSQRSKVKIADLWTEIHDILRDYMSLDAIKKRWRTIRDRYIRTKNKKYVPSGSGIEDRSAPSDYKFHHLLKFIDDARICKRTTCNLNEDKLCNSDEEKLKAENATPTSSKLKRKNVEQLSLEAELIKKIKEPTGKEVDQLDEVDHFCKSLASGLRKLSFKERLKLQIKYMQLLEEASE